MERGAAGSLSEKRRPPETSLTQNSTPELARPCCVFREADSCSLCEITPCPVSLYPAELVGPFQCGYATLPNTISESSLRVRKRVRQKHQRLLLWSTVR